MFQPIHNEKELLGRIAEGDRSAFKALYEWYYPVVQKYVVLFEPSRDYLDELTQDIFIKIWEKRDKLEGIESFKDYLFLMVRNTVFNYFRAMKARKPTKELDDVDVAVGEGSEAALLYKQYYMIVIEAMDKLPSGRQKILKMSIDQGMSLDEIAAELQISRSGVKKQLYAATAYVREYLKEHGEMSAFLFVFLSLFDK